MRIHQQMAFPKRLENNLKKKKRNRPNNNILQARGFQGQRACMFLATVNQQYYVLTLNFEIPKVACIFLIFEYC